MGLFDFLFGSDESSFNTEDYRSMSEDRRHRASGSGNWTSREDWDCGDYDSEACRDLIRMRIMIFKEQEAYSPYGIPYDLAQPSGS